MDVMVVNGKEVVKCPHCDGSGMCGNTAEFSIPSPAKAGSDAHSHGRKYAECSYCGRGLTVPSSQATRPPICLVCSGKGYNKV